MKTPDTSKKVKVKEELRVTPILIKMGQVFYRSNGNERSVDSFTPEAFDTLALSFVDGIDDVKRDIWDVFARAKFLNWLVREGDMNIQAGEDGSILLSRSEIFISDLKADKPAPHAVFAELACGCISQATGGWVGTVEWSRLHIQCPNGHGIQQCVRQVEKPSTSEGK